MSKSYEGYIVISDITGYTAYLSGSELDHATETLQDLLNTLLDHTQPPLVVSRLEGDSVFAYTPKGSILQGQTLVEMVETIYVAFRRALELMELNTTCMCKACRNIPNLDLKFFIHHGTYALQQLGAGSHKELVGTDVNLAHRLTKNSVVETTGIKAYAMYTQAAMDAAGLGDMVGQLVDHTESYEHIGEVQTYVQDMHDVWQAKRDQQRILVEPSGSTWTIEGDLPLPPAQAWEYVTKPEFRAVLTGSDNQQVSGRNQGRLGEGTEYICAHGDSVVVQTILDWQPFESYTYHTDGLLGTTYRATMYLEPTADGNGTHIVQASSPPIGSIVVRIAFLVAWLALIRRPAEREWHSNLQALVAQIEEDLAAGIAVRSTSQDVPRESVPEAVVASLATSQEA
jgi:uncharacterized protein YndB with AHSA1/START domain